MAPIGAGGIGEVYRARDERLGRDVAIKVLAEKGSAEQILRLDREARTVGALNHPNILAVFDVGTSEGQPYVVSELLEGESLRTWISTGPVLPRKAVEMARQVAQGLAAAHDKGICHRDIKPENLFLTPDGRVKILDFGLAKRGPSLDAGTATRLLSDFETESGTVLGTAGYMSPEQVRGQPADARSDLFAFGAVLYEMLAGRRPFRGDSPVETMHAILNEDPPPLASLDPSLPPSLATLVRRCLEKNPEERFQSARDVAFSLEEILGVWHTSRPAAVLSGPAGRRARGALLLLAAAAGAVLALAVARATSRRPVPTFEQVTFHRGLIQAARFAPEGGGIVFGAGWEGAPPQAWFTLGSNPESRPLTDAGTTILSLSDQGEMALAVGYRYAGGERSVGTLARAPLAGGAPRELLEGVEDADWAPLGKALAVVRSQGAGTPSRLEYPIGKTLIEGSAVLHNPRVSPRGDLVAVIDDATGIGYGGAVAVVDSGGRRSVLTRHWANARGLAWSPSGDEVWFTAGDEGGSRAIHAVNLRGRERLVAQFPGSSTLRDIATDGRVLLTQDAERRGIRGVVPGHETETELSWLDRSGMGDLSADGRFLLFGDRFRVYFRRTDGSPAVALGEGHADAVAPDGRWALTTSVDGRQLVIMPTGPGEPQTVTPHGITSYAGAWWLAALRRRILFNGRLGGSALRCYVQSLEGGPPRAISPEGTWALGLSPDASLAVVTNQDHALALYPTEGQAPAREVRGSEPGDRPAGWSLDGRLLWVYRRDDLPVRVFEIDLATGRRRPWKSLMPSDPAGLLSVAELVVTPDGRYYAYTYRRILSDLYVARGLS